MQRSMSLKYEPSSELPHRPTVNVCVCLSVCLYLYLCLCVYLCLSVYVCVSLLNGKLEETVCFFFFCVTLEPRVECCKGL